MRVAIVGSRTGVDLASVQDYVRRVAETHPDATILSGGARGVDQVAERAAEHFGLACESYPAGWEGGKRAGKERNWRLMRDAEVVVAFWDGWSNGTAHAVTAATHLGKQVWVYAPVVK